MGNSVDSKLHEALCEGNEKKAQAHWEELQKKPKSFDMNSVYYPNEAGNTVVLSAAAGGCQYIYRDLLATRNLHLEKKNTREQNIVHLLCVHRGILNQAQLLKRKKMLEMTLEYEKCSSILLKLLNGKDKLGNTPLHCAAESGLKTCVELIVDRGIEIFEKNNAELTACDLAMSNGHQDIADLLESRMVFATPIEQAGNEDLFPVHLLEDGQVPKGITIQEVRCAKDVVLIETADLLGVPLFSAEALLKSQEWSRDQLVEAWFTDPVETCEKAGIPIPDLGMNPVEGGLSLNPEPLGVLSSREDQECTVCFCTISDRIQLICEHMCCRECWEKYLTEKVENNDIQDVFCPGYGCFTRVPVDIIEKVIPRETARKFLQYDIRLFVESNPNMCWCPQPGCDKVVAMFGENKQVLLQSDTREKRPHNVHCGEGHFFCWKCAGEPHEPCACEQWTEWKSEMEEMSKQLGEVVSTAIVKETVDDMNALWLAEYSKRCPKCKSHIEKTVGCNHMTCRKCKHDFCWVCLDPWNIHSSATGGYFECRREKEIDKVKKEKEEVLKDVKEKVAISKFKETYQLYHTQCKKLKVEQEFLDKCEPRMEQLKMYAERQLPHIGASASTTDVGFLKNGLFDLVKTRQVLKASFVYGHKIESNRSQERDKFTELLDKLILVTEILSNMVAKSHLRHRQSDIIRATSVVVQERAVFLSQLPELKKLPKDPTPRSSVVADMEEGHIDMLEHLLRIITERAEDDDVGLGRGTMLRNILERRRRLRQRLHHEDDGVGGDLSSNSTDTEPDEEDDGIMFPSMTATRVPSLFSRRSNNNGGDSPARNRPIAEEVGGRRRGYTLPHPAVLSRPSLQRRPRTPPPEEPPLYHPPRQLTLVRRPPFQRRCNNTVPRADTPECDESMFQTVTSTSNDSNRFTNDLSNSPVTYPYLPPLPPILRPLDSPPQQPHTHTSPNRLSVPPSRVGPVSSSESNSSPLFGGSDYDEDEAMMTAMRESMREVEREGQMEEDAEYERQLQLALALSVHDTGENSTPTLPTSTLTGYTDA